MQAQHPECPARLSTILEYLRASGLSGEWRRRDATALTRDEAKRLHAPEYVDALYRHAPTTGFVQIDSDTFMGPRSLAAAERAAGAMRDAVHLVLSGEAKRVFCAVRPPGHHAEESAGMGFCFFNNVALGARVALENASIERVAILDFDVHHGNGTVDLFKNDPRVLVCSSFQHPHYPGRLDDLDLPNIVNTPLPAGTASTAFRRAVERDWVPALVRHEPDLVLVSAGFDAHTRDPLGDLELVEDDYRWITDLIVSFANDYAEGRVVSTLEGGYDLDALARSVGAHLERMTG
jgi:acetoin utilization deacetylase AcuC-like enzyme